MASSSNAQKAKGGQKVVMKRIENEINLQVTFSKRRRGLFKKASELCTLTGAEIGIVVYSPSKKSFSFGHPSIHKVIQKVFPTPQIHSHPHDYEMFIESRKNATIVDYNKQLSMLDQQLKYEQTRNLALVEKEKVERARIGWGTLIEELSVAKLEEMKMALHDLKEKIGHAMNHREPNLVSASCAPQTSNLSLNPLSFQGYGFEGPGPIPMTMINTVHNPLSVSRPDYGCFGFGQGINTSTNNTQTSNLSMNSLSSQRYGFEGSNPIPMMNTHHNPSSVSRPNYECPNSEQGLNTFSINTQTSSPSVNPLDFQGYGLDSSYPIPIMTTTNPPPNYLSFSGPDYEFFNSRQATNAFAINTQGIVPWSGNM